MSLLVTDNNTIKNAVAILESMNKVQQDKMLRLLKLEQARHIAKRIDKKAPSSQMTDMEIRDVVSTIRKSYRGK